MKNSTLFLCLGLDGLGAYFASLTPEDWLRIVLVLLSLISVLSSFIIKVASKIKDAKEKKQDPIKTAEEIIADAKETSEMLQNYIDKSLKKEEKKTSKYRIKE